MNTHTQFGIFTTPWEAERAQAEAELYQIERERALEDIARLIRRFDLTVDEVRGCIDSFCRQVSTPVFTPFEPYFGGR